jgi:hypothetical protein
MFCDETLQVVVVEVEGVVVEVDTPLLLVHLVAESLQQKEMLSSYYEP